MRSIITINNRKFITKTSAARLLRYSNRNSIDDLISKGKIQSFRINGLNKSFIPLDQVTSHPRYFND